MATVEPSSCDRPITIVTIEVWSEHLAVTPLAYITDEEIEARDAWNREDQRRRQETPALLRRFRRLPPRVERDFTRHPMRQRSVITDDVGTTYVSHRGSGGEDRQVWRETNAYIPAPPALATVLAVRCGDASPVEVRLPRS